MDIVNQEVVDINPKHFLIALVVGNQYTDFFKAVKLNTKTILLQVKFCFCGYKLIETY